MKRIETDKLRATAFWWNPIEYIQKNMIGTKQFPRLTKRAISHIEFDPNVKKDYNIIRQQTHDGTFWFTYDMINKAMLALINKTTRHIRAGIDWKNVDVLKYTIGWIKISSVYYDEVDLRCGKCPGEKERLRIPVKCEYERA